MTDPQAQMSDEELSAAIREVRDRARAKVPQGPLAIEGVFATDLMPLVHARDAAEAKVAAIGTVNPRSGGVVNSLVQSVKRTIARSLNWFIREQVEFNRASIDCVQASIEALNATNRNMAVMAANLKAELAGLEAQVREFDALHQRHQEVDRWRQEAQWGEIHILRTISELQAAYQHRLTIQESASRDLANAQHRNYLDALERSSAEIQKRMWDDLAIVRQEFEHLIHDGLRLVRQKNTDAVVAVRGSAPNQVQTTFGNDQIDLDWSRFADRFRGSEDRILGQQDRYLARFAGAQGVVLDIGCGRGEFLEAARKAGIVARGIDISAESVAICVSKGLDAERAELFTYLEDQLDGSIGGGYCAQVIEHLTPGQLVRLVDLLSKKVRKGAVVAFETPNPSCLAIFATHFYIDPTHVRPVPSTLLHYYMEAAGFGDIEVEGLEPAIDTMPSLAELPVAFREQFFGALDYALFATRL